MALQTWKCKKCEKTFKVGEWRCVDGGNHEVEPKTFRSLDAPGETGKFVGQPPIVRGRTMVCNIPPPHKEIEGTDTRWVGMGTVEFINGRYTTTDPEQQYYLEKKGPAYNATEEQWKNTWLTDTEKLEDTRLQLVAEKQRLENENNALLAQVQVSKGR